jgi:hypothetical protein
MYRGLDSWVLSSCQYNWEGYEFYGLYMLPNGHVVTVGEVINIWALKLVTGRSNHWTSDYKLFLIHPLLHITICSNMWVFFYEIETGWQCDKSQSLQSAGLIQGEILLKLKFRGRFCFFAYASIYCPENKKIVNYLNFSDVPSFTIHWVI